MPPTNPAELRELSERATAGLLRYRPDAYDDWGWLKGDDGSIVAVARANEETTDFNAHREAKTDPYEPNGRFIVALWNAYRSGSLPEREAVPEVGAGWAVQWLVRQAKDERLTPEERLSIIANFPASPPPPSVDRERVEKKDRAYWSDRLARFRNDGSCERELLDNLLAQHVPTGGAGWRDISTAPRDGTAILVHRNIWPGTPSGFSEECNGHNTYVAEWWVNEHGGEWMLYTDQSREPPCPIDPTHWMPLPPPPSLPQPPQENPA